MARKNIRLRVKNLVKKMGTAGPLQIATMLNIPIATEYQGIFNASIEEKNHHLE
ncbi:MAG: hypothetical protein KHX20_04665 [Megasphaera sp.]|jgi:hypothetical protein|nr:hypothetical protein [Megasphaera sp.]